ncbi:MAG: CAP domain-containing protein [Myxococcota bacterium]
MGRGARWSGAVGMMLALLGASSGCGGSETRPWDDDDDGGGTAAGGGDRAGDTTTSGGPDPGEPAGLEGILAAHNDARAAHGQAPLTWDDDLEAIAAAWGAACTDDEPPAGLIDHNGGRSDTYPEYVGENIYASSAATSGPAAVTAWMSEEADYDYDANSCQGVCGHYTQVVWAETTKVGCAIANCPSLQFGWGVVCNYAPGGNVGGRRPY